MLVRDMETNELDVVINLFNYYKDDVRINDDNWNSDNLLKTIKEYCIRPHLYFKVAFQATRPVGVIGGFVANDIVESETTGTIQFLFLLPEYRTQEYYKTLVGGFEEWARDCGATKLRAIDIGYNLDRLNEVYDLLGYSPVRFSLMTKEL